MSLRYHEIYRAMHLQYRIHPTWISCLQPAVQHVEVPGLDQSTLGSSPGGVAEDDRQSECNLEGNSKDTPHCFRRTNIVTILIMVNFICSTIWRDNDGCMVWTLGDVLVDVLDTSKELAQNSTFTWHPRSMER